MVNMTCVVQWLLCEHGSFIVDRFINGIVGYMGDHSCQPASLNHLTPLGKYVHVLEHFKEYRLLS